jgi:hypothetical protein
MSESIDIAAEAQRLAEEKIAAARAEAGEVAEATSTEPRAILRRAIEAKAAIDERAKQARAAISKAQRMATDAADEVERLSGVAQELAEHHAEQIATAALKGGDLASLETPAKLKARKAEAAKAEKASVEAIAQLEEVGAAEGVLSDGLTSTEHDAQEAADEIKIAALAVIAEEAERELSEAIRLQGEVWRRVDFLNGVKDLMRRHLAPRFQAELANLDKNPQRQALEALETKAFANFTIWRDHIADHRREALRVWQRFEADLKANADAALGDLERVK